MHSHTSSSVQPPKVLLAMVGGLASLGAHAQTGGLTKVSAGLSWIQVSMLALSATIITIALIWTGWQILFEGKHFQEVARVFFGAILIGAAPGLGALFVS